MKKNATFIVFLFLVSMTLSGQNSTMTIREVFDFQPGDVFHWKVLHQPQRPPEGKRVEVLARNLSPGNDSICYSLKHFDYSSVVGPGPFLVYTYKNYLSTKCYTNLDSLVHTLIDTVLLITTPVSIIDSTYLDQDLCDSLTYKYTAYYGLWFEPRIIIQSFGRGLGITSYYNDYQFSLPPEYSRWYMVYFKKGPFDCGTPDTTSTGIKQPDEVAGIVRCFPNPATTHLNLEFDVRLASTEKTITLSNTIGQEVFRQEYMAGNQSVTLNVNNLPSGTYFLKVSGIGFPWVVRKVMKN